MNYIIIIDMHLNDNKLYISHIFFFYIGVADE